MKLEYDKEVDCAYIYLDYPMKDGEAKKTIEINDNQKTMCFWLALVFGCSTWQEARWHIIVDLNDKGQLIGIEVLDVSKVLSMTALINAVVA